MGPGRRSRHERETVDSRARIREFIATNFNIEFDEEVNEYSNLFQLGFINSYGYLKIMNFLESEFDISMTKDDILSSMPSSLLSFYEFVEHRKK
jgi:D-alanine--poly(phosphoribitol) ligase subunit 2